MAWRQPRKIGSILGHSSAARFVGWDGKVLQAIADLLQSQFGVQVVVPPWQGTTAVVQVSHPADRKMMRYKEDKIILLFNSVLGDGRIRSVKVTLAGRS